MGHSKELLAKIADQLRQLYPEPEYRYAFEKGLQGRDRRHQPDIQVFEASGAIRCVVEIGYTRPEKLKVYCDANIPDVRWYAKDGRLMALPRFESPGPLTRVITYRSSAGREWRS